MVGAGEGGGEVQAVRLGATDIVGRQLETLDVHGVLLAALADPLGGDLHAVGQDVAQALALADHVEQPDHRLVVAEAQIESAGVLQGEDAALEELHGEGDGDPGRHGVEPELVGQTVAGDDGVGVVHAGHAAEGVEGLVFGPLGEETGVGPVWAMRSWLQPTGHPAQAVLPMPWISMA